MAYQHNLIPFNCVIKLIHKNQVLTYLFPHIPSHSFQQFKCPKHMDLYDPFHTNWDCFYSPKTGQVGCQRAAHSSYIGSSWWNRIPWLFPASYLPTYNLFNKLSSKHPKQSLKLIRTAQLGLKNSNTSVPRFGIDQTAPHGLNQLKYHQTLK